MLSERSEQPGRNPLLFVERAQRAKRYAFIVKKKQKDSTGEKKTKEYTSEKQPNDYTQEKNQSNIQVKTNESNI